jgi:hypothetical protein
MLEFLQKPYLFAFALALLTAVLAYLYGRTTDKDQATSNKTFFKTLAAGVLSGAVLTYVSNARPELVATEPFDVAVTGV